jgi:hypothetical protein
VARAFATLEITNDFWIVCGECPWLLYRLVRIFADEAEEASVKIDFGHIS